MLFIFRILLSVISAIICAIAIDDSLYKSNIEGEIKKNIQNLTIDSTECKSYTLLKESRNTEIDFINKLENLKKPEIEKDNSRRNLGGYSINFEFYNINFKKYSKEKKEAEALVRSYETKIAEEISTKQNEMKFLQENSILARLEALYKVITSSKIGLIIYTLFSLFILFLELSPLIFKSTYSRTKYEKEIELREFFDSDLAYSQYKELR